MFRVPEGKRGEKFLKLNIAVAGSNTMNAEEVLDAVRLILGNLVRDAMLVITKEITDTNMADLFICATTQAEELAKRVPSNKIIVLDLQPTSQFFVEVARIPAGQTVYVFNSNSKYAKRLVESCHRVGIRDVEFILLGYEELSEQKVTASLRKAKYIMGIAKQVGETILLSPPYADFLRTDVHIIGIHRVASMQSACLLIQWSAAYFQQTVTRQVSMITTKLRQAAVQNQANDEIGDLSCIANELERLLTESNQLIFTMHDAVMKSFANQISPHITMVDYYKKSANSKTADQDGSSNREIVETLENISSLNEKYLSLSKKLSTIK